MLAKLYRDDSIDYIRTHEKRLPYVVLARWGRITGLYKPLQQTALDHFPEGRSIWVARGALAGWYIVAPLAIGGALVLRRRRIPVFPLLGPPIVVWIAVTITFSTTRYRASAEGALCLLAAVGVDALVGLYERLRDDPEDVPPVDEPERELVERLSLQTQSREPTHLTADATENAGGSALRALGDREEDEGRRVDRLGDRELVCGDRRRLGRLAVQERVGHPASEGVKPDEP